MKPQKCLFIKYPKPKSNRPYGSKPRFGRGVILEAVLISAFLVVAWCAVIFLYGLVTP